MLPWRWRSQVSLQVWRCCTAWRDAHSRQMYFNFGKISDSTVLLVSIGTPVVVTSKILKCWRTSQAFFCSIRYNTCLSTPASHAHCWRYYWDLSCCHTVVVMDWPPLHHCDSIPWSGKVQWTVLHHPPRSVDPRSHLIQLYVWHQALSEWVGTLDPSRSWTWRWVSRGESKGGLSDKRWV